MSWFDVLKYYPSARAEDASKNYNLPMKIEQNPDGSGFKNLPTYQEFMAEQNRLKTEHASAVKNGDMAIATLLENLMRMNMDKMNNFYPQGANTRRM